MHLKVLVCMSTRSPDMEALSDTEDVSVVGVIYRHFGMRGRERYKIAFFNSTA